MQTQDARARALLAEATGSGFVSKSPLAFTDDRGQPQWFPVSYSTTYSFPAAYAFDAGDAWAFAYGPQPLHCAPPNARSRNDAAATADWFDCLLDTAARDVATRTMHGMPLTAVGFAPTRVSRTKPLLQ